MPIQHLALGWLPGVIDLDEETIAFFAQYHGAVSPDGPERFRPSSIACTARSRR